MSNLDRFRFCSGHIFPRLLKSLPTRSQEGESVGRVWPWMAMISRSRGKMTAEQRRKSVRVRLKLERCAPDALEIFRPPCLTRLKRLISRNEKNGDPLLEFSGWNRLELHDVCRHRRQEKPVKDPRKFFGHEHSDPCRTPRSGRPVVQIESNL